MLKCKQLKQLAVNMLNAMFLIQALNNFTYDTLKQGDKIINCLILWNNMNGCFYL
jgi:hypothetical protein